MKTVMVQIDKETDLLVVEAMFNNLGLKYETEDEWSDLSEPEIEGIKAGLDDIEAGRVFTHAEVMAQVNEQFKELRGAK